MKRSLKLILGIVAALLALALVALGYLVHTRQARLALEHSILTNGPWGGAAVWVSADGSSYLVGELEEDQSPPAVVTAYFQDGTDWHAFELNCIGSIAYLNSIDPEPIVETTEGRIKFDGTTFRLRVDDWQQEFRYTRTEEAFSPD